MATRKPTSETRLKAIVCGSLAPLLLLACSDPQPPIYYTASGAPPDSVERYWTPERMRNARPMPLPTVPDDRAPRDSSDDVEGYWTRERMRNARPMPLPTVPEDDPPPSLKN